MEQLQAEIQIQFNTLNFYINAVNNTVRLPEILYRDIRGHIDQITNLAKQATMMGGYTSTMLSNLSAGAYPITGALSYSALIAKQSAAVAQALTQAGKVLDAQTDRLSDSGATLTAMHNQAVNSDSRNGILQALTGTTAATGQLVVTQQAAVGSSMQALMTAETARAERESYNVAIVNAYQNAGIRASCSQVPSWLVVKACQ